MIIPAMPLLLRVFADRLREDQGRQLGRAVLFASVVGFDVVERRKGDIALVSGVPAARVQEIVDTGRQALSAASPRRPEQHLISRALMRQFCIPTNQGDRLLSYNLQFGRTRLLPTRQVGKLTDFVRIDSEATEQLWGRTEQDLPAAIKAARTSRVLRNPKHVAVIKDAIALHYARSRATLESVQKNWQETLATARSAYMANRPAMEELFYQKHGYWAGGSTVAGEIADDLLSGATALTQSGAYFRLRVVDIFEEASRMASAARLEILWSRRSRFHFLFGDVPAVTIPDGAPFGHATTVFLPLSPTRLAALSRTDRFGAVAARAVRQANARQVAKARDYVYMHPASGLDAFVASVRPPTGPVRP
ncbi:MAG TPA: DUF4238 domain-containing protein [Streptosporangiaceae bacterium]|nr:DUF4238 domain-containing protein [Streptosporangiaceae bacterium]